MSMRVRKILLVDDDREDRAIMNDALRLLGEDEIIWHAENGEDGLSILEKNYALSSIPCLIVLDLNMPRMSGTQTLRMIKGDERFKDIPVIIYSTSVNPLEKKATLLLGAHSYITKPVSFNESMETAKIFLGFCALTPAPKP
jgi:CheY-like chemotaxis protein